MQTDKPADIVARIAEIRSELAALAPQVREAKAEMHKAMAPYEQLERDTGICQDGAIDNVFDCYRGVLDDEIALMEELAWLQDEEPE